jgi:hypothetical protein
MNDFIETTGTASIPIQSASRDFVLDLGGPCLQATVQALLNNDGDGRMAPEDRDVAVSEAARFAESILGAYVSEFGASPRNRLTASATNAGSVPTGLLYGCVQSGKTRAITLTTAILFDNGVRLIVVLTSNNVELVQQTADRLQAVDGVQIISSLEQDRDRWSRDARHIASHIDTTGLLVVCQKERNHQRQLISFLREIEASGLPAVIFDDEGDQATPDTTQAARMSGRPSAPAHGSTTFRLTVMNDNQQELGESLLETLSTCVFVQVTATPYALLLQGTDHPLRPKFTCLIDPGQGYLGGEWFFPSRSADGPAEPPLVEVPGAEASELEIRPLHVPPEMLRRAIAYFCLSAAVLELSTKQRSKFGYSFLCHTSSRKADHSHLEKLISVFLEQINKDLIREVSGEVTDAFAWAATELRKTASDMIDSVSYDSVKQWISKKVALRSIRVINAESDKLTFTTGLNFLIGGNILGRGLTIKQLLVTYYMRSARSTQMDTMLQHARMFGYRGHLKPLIRVFLPRVSIVRFVEIVKSEQYVRSLIKDATVTSVPIRIASSLNATRRNVLDLDALDAYRGGSQIYPFEPEFESASLLGSTERITAILEQKAFDGSLKFRTPTEIGWDLFEELVRSVRVRETDDSRWMADAIVSVAHALEKGEDGTPGLRPILWVRESARRAGGSGSQLLTGIAGGDDRHPTFNGRLVLMMFRNAGREEEGWAGASFWYPTVQLPTHAGVFLFNAA